MTGQLDMTLSALAHPTRRAILAHLMSGQRTVTELAEPFEMTMPAVTKHIKVLEAAGLIERGRDAQKRPCRLRAAPLKEVNEENNGYYMLSFEASYPLGDEGYREVEVETVNPEFKVRARKGYRYGA